MALFGSFTPNNTIDIDSEHGKHIEVPTLPVLMETMAKITKTGQL
jgi:hypothetical protein